MTDHTDLYRGALARAVEHTTAWLDSVDTRSVGPTATADEIIASLPTDLPEHGSDPVDVIDELAAAADPGLMAMPSGRFFGWVIGGSLPSALAADWLVSAWDQNAAMRLATPGTAGIEETAGRWLLQALGLPEGCGVGFTTGATMANFVGLGAGRKWVLDRLGWDVNLQGLSGAPDITVLVGAERHASVELALRYLGLGAPTLVAADAQGRIIPAALEDALSAIDGPVIVCLQAGNLHSGAIDPMREAVAISHKHGAWVHVDGAFGLWAAVSPQFAEQVDGLDTADSWATDAHKTLNVPYDSGIVFVSRPEVLDATFGTRTDYLLHDERGPSDPFERVPEFSRRARGVPVWAALRELGREGVIALVEGLAANARALADGIGALDGVEVLNDVVFTQVCLAFGSDERTRRVTQAVIKDGAVWMSGSRWQGRDILRISVSNWATNADDVAASVAAIQRALETA